MERMDYLSLPLGQSVLIAIGRVILYWVIYRGGAEGLSALYSPICKQLSLQLPNWENKLLAVSWAIEPE